MTIKPDLTPEEASAVAACLTFALDTVGETVPTDSALRSALVKLQRAEAFAKAEQARAEYDAETSLRSALIQYTSGSEMLRLMQPRQAHEGQTVFRGNEVKPFEPESMP